MGEVSKRSSNLELCRIVCIIFILIHHLIVHGWKPFNALESSLSLSLINALCFIGVNVFVLISGYFQIKFSWHKLLRIYLQCFIYGGIFYLIHLFYDGQSIGFSFIYNTFLCISHAPGWWYIKVYLYLFILAPFINLAINNSSKKQLLFTILGLSIISVYFGFIFQDPVNSDGYNLINFVWLYCIGSYLKLYVNNINFRWYYLCVYISSGIILGSLGFFVKGVPIWTYNNPLLVISSISFFLFFTTLNFESKFINYIALSTLGVYLIQENAYFLK